MLSDELDSAIRKLSKMLCVGYVDETRYVGDIVSSEDRDYNDLFQFDVKKQTISFPSTSGLIDDTVKTVVEVKELITDPEHVYDYDDCILTILRETGEVDS